jgi:hypothetical protein
MSICQHGEEVLRFELSNRWVCGDCDDVLNGSQLDINHIDIKVQCIMMELDMNGEISVSGSTNGEIIEKKVISKCKASKIYTLDFIKQKIKELLK